MSIKHCLYQKSLNVSRSWDNVEKCKKMFFLLMETKECQIKACVVTSYISIERWDVYVAKPKFKRYCLGQGSPIYGLRSGTGLWPVGHRAARIAGKPPHMQCVLAPPPVSRRHSGLFVHACVRQQSVCACASSLFAHVQECQLPAMDACGFLCMHAHTSTTAMHMLVCACICVGCAHTHFPVPPFFSRPPSWEGWGTLA